MEIESVSGLQAAVDLLGTLQRRWLLLNAERSNAVAAAERTNQAELDELKVSIETVTKSIENGALDLRSKGVLKPTQNKMQPGVLGWRRSSRMIPSDRSLDIIRCSGPHTRRKFIVVEERLNAHALKTATLDELKIFGILIEQKESFYVKTGAEPT